VVSWTSRCEYLQISFSSPIFYFLILSVTTHNNTLSLFFFFLLLQTIGYPVGIGGEMYGGSMFIKSAASETNQGKAIQSINEKWGGTDRTWNGRETIGVQVCKKKYTPFLFTVETTDDGEENDAKNGNAAATSTAASGTTTTAAGNGGRKKIVKVVRVFGCPHHSQFRKEKIECYGTRKGWENFGQWSLRKAQQLARRETNRLNNKNKNDGDGDGDGDDCSSEDNKQGIKSSSSSSSNGGKNVASNNTTGGTSKANTSNSDNEEIKTICHNGKCTWKMKEKYDNVYNEIMGYGSSSEEDT
jgi:hypothetical protein